MHGYSREFKGDWRSDVWTSLVSLTLLHGVSGEGRIGVLGRHDWTGIGGCNLERERIFCFDAVEKRQEVLYPK